MNIIFLFSSMPLRAMECDTWFDRIFNEVGQEGTMCIEENKLEQLLTPPNSDRAVDSATEQVTAIVIKGDDQQNALKILQREDGAQRGEMLLTSGDAKEYMLKEKKQSNYYDISTVVPQTDGTLRTKKLCSNSRTAFEDLHCMRQEFWEEDKEGLIVGGNAKQDVQKMLLQEDDVQKGRKRSKVHGSRKACKKQKKWFCFSCSQSFVRQYAFECHVKSHIVKNNPNLRPFRCKHCKDGLFSYPHYLIRHLKKQHGIMVESVQIDQAINNELLRQMQPFMLRSFHDS